MDVRSRSKAARKIWDTADKFTRETLGFSVLHVVRDNPTSLIASVASGCHMPRGLSAILLTVLSKLTQYPPPCMPPMLMPAATAWYRNTA